MFELAVFYVFELAVTFSAPCFPFALILDVTLP